MKLLIEKRPFSWENEYDVYDEKGRFTYRITTERKDRISSIFVASQYGGEIGKIVKTKKLFKTTYEIFLGGDYMGKVKKETMYGGVTRYVLDYARWRVFGTVLNWEYDIVDDKYIIAHAGDDNMEHDGKFVIDTEYSNNEAPILLIALAMEAATADHHKGS